MSNFFCLFVLYSAFAVLILLIPTFMAALAGKAETFIFLRTLIIKTLALLAVIVIGWRILELVGLL